MDGKKFIESARIACERSGRELVEYGKKAEKQAKELAENLKVLRGKLPDGALPELTRWHSDFQCRKCGASDWRDDTVAHPVTYILSTCLNCGFTLG